ncbi:MAG TPA: hypothetical protein VEP73_08490, partial [Actinomycetota bacterium]|nr:hypothetical protein [Actinomycetota bacterium]
ELARRNGTEALAGLPSDPDKLRAEWDAASVDRRRAIVRAVLDSVIIGPYPGPAKGRWGNVFDPDRVEIRWKE